MILLLFACLIYVKVSTLSLVIVCSPLKASKQVIDFIRGIIMAKLDDSSHIIVDTFPRLDEFLAYLSAIKGRSDLTIREYHYDLRLFFHWYLQTKFADYKNIELDMIDLRLVDDKLLAAISLTDFYQYIAWLATKRNASVANRARKCSSLKTFFKFLSQKIHILKVDPASELELPRQYKRLPKYLNLEQTQSLLDSSLKTMATDYKYSPALEKSLALRNYCILILFLNCGMRLSELQKLNCQDINQNERTLRVIGKGNKERTIYLNDACIDALQHYMNVRLPAAKNYKAALFISRQGNRLSRSMIQHMIKQTLSEAGLANYNFSVHKLRHTAATLMYQFGHVDIRSLQEILGHESVATTEIYTHTNEELLHQAVESNPLANKKLPKAVETEAANEQSKANKK